MLAGVAAVATAGTGALQDVMFRGHAPSTFHLSVLGGYAIVSLGLAYLWLRRRRVASRRAIGRGLLASSC